MARASPSPACPSLRSFAVGPNPGGLRRCAPLQGLEHLEGIAGPELLGANHLTAIDGPMLVGRPPWRRARRAAIAMNGEQLSAYYCPAPSLPWFWRLARRVQDELRLLA